MRWNHLAFLHWPVKATWLRPHVPSELELETYRGEAWLRGRRLDRGEIHHAPWPLQSAQSRVRINTMMEPLGIELQGEPRVHYARRLDVVGWLPEAVE